MEKHYGIVEWVEFARGMVSQDTQASMANHLMAGCSDCQKTADFFQKLARVCRDMVPDNVPDAVVERARSIYPRSLPGQPEQTTRIPVELIYDSRLTPAPAGLGASKDLGWRILYRASDCSLDFRVEPELRTSRITVVGQILTDRSPQSEMSNLSVVLKSGKTTIAETLSNQFGEFQMECEQRKQMHLCIYLRGGAQLIEIPLHRFAKDKGSERN